MDGNEGIKSRHRRANRRGNVERAIDSSVFTADVIFVNFYDTYEGHRTKSASRIGTLLLYDMVQMRVGGRLEKTVTRATYGSFTMSKRGKGLSVLILIT